jgi:hypothetical protein
MPNIIQHARVCESNPTPALHFVYNGENVLTLDNGYLYYRGERCKDALDVHKRMSEFLGMHEQHKD